MDKSGGESTFSNSDGNFASRTHHSGVSTCPNFERTASEKDRKTNPGAVSPNRVASMLFAEDMSADQLAAKAFQKCCHKICTL